MDSDALSKLVEKLHDLKWVFFSGFAVEVYTNGIRKGGDVDIIVFGKDIDIFAHRLKTMACFRKIKKDSYIVDDYAFETNFNGIDIEATSGFPRKRIENNTLKRIFDNRVKKNYLGVDVFLAPLEELIVHKAVMKRQKDITDLKLLVNNKINPALLKKFADDWGFEGMKTLCDIGYDV